MMKKIFCTVILVIFFGCKSIEKHNAQMDRFVSIEQQQSDLAFAKKRMEKIVPNLYAYIKKERWEAQYDSLVKTIDKPLKPNDFYFKISPMVASIKQGHITVNRIVKRYTTKEHKAFDKKGKGPLSQFDWEWDDSHLYIIKNNSKDSTIALGTKVLSINGIKPIDLYEKHKKCITSDGTNQTFIPRIYERIFPSHLLHEIGVQDSLLFEFSHKDTVFLKNIKRLPKEKTDSTTKSGIKDTLKPKKKTKEELNIAKGKRKQENKKKRYFGYDYTNKEYIKSLDFKGRDSTVAYLKIKNFSGGNYKKAYEKLFDSIKNKGSKSLILDLRNNPGGRIADINELYAYLTDKDFQLVHKAKINSRGSVVRHADFFYYLPNVAKVFAAPFYPIYASTLYLKSGKNKQGYTFNVTGSKFTKSKSQAFSGKIYVLIDGGSFSASCIIASKLKENPNVVFVGEETGGAANGTVAGRTSTRKLPNSKLALRLWVMELVPTYIPDQFGKGITPHIEIITSIDELITKKDRALEWIINDIQK